MIINPGDAEGAPYRRLRVLKNLKGIAYEAPDPKNINAEFREIGSDNMSLPQLGKIITQLRDLKLAKFYRGGQGEREYDTWGETITIKDLDLKLLDKLIKQTRSDIRKNSDSDYQKRNIFKKIHLPERFRGFSKRHPIVKAIYVPVAATIITTVILAVVPATRDFFIHHIFLQSKSTSVNQKQK